MRVGGDVAEPAWADRGLEVEGDDVAVALEGGLLQIWLDGVQPLLEEGSNADPLGVRRPVVLEQPLRVQRCPPGLVLGREPRGFPTSQE